MELRRLNAYTYDVFINSSWNEWSRVRQGRVASYVVAGQRLPKFVLNYLHDALHPAMPITPGQSLEDMLFNNNAINSRK